MGLDPMAARSRHIHIGRKVIVATESSEVAVNPSHEASATRAPWTNLLTTPLSDLMRGRLTGRLGIGTVLSDAAFAEPLTDLIYRVARRTRLWRVERVDVARELVEHFRDGLAAGRTPEQLVESFGDERQAARLIRRAKLRGRPLFWRVWRRAVQGLATIAALVVGCYLFLAIRLFAHHPTIAHNYGLDLIAPTQGVAEADRAWPFYREALLHLTPEPSIADTSNAPPGDVDEAEPLPNLPLVPLNIAEERPGSKHWGKVERWLDENQLAIKMAREGAARPRFGFVYGDLADRAWLESEKIEPEAIDPTRNEQIIAFMLPQQQRVRHLGDLLEADARRALAAGDREAFLSDVDSLVKMANQLEGDLAFLVVDLISYLAYERAVVLIDEALAGHAEVLRDEDFAHLAHIIAGYAGGGPIIPRLAGERADFHDFVQRIYSDDGRGGGSLTYQGLKLLEHFWRTEGQPTREQILVTSLWAPVAGGILPRREMLERGDAIYDRAEAEFQRPLWQWDSDDYEQQLRLLFLNPIDRIRYAPLLILMHPIKSCYARAQLLMLERDATLVALALTLFHRRHGTWPERLDELVPDLLPIIPADRFTGEPIRYRVVGERPVVYSVGPDKEDNGGQPPDVPEHERAPLYRSAIRPGDLPGTRDIRFGWDWILWAPRAESSPNSVE
jgi:hypothetical protein